MCIRDSVRTEVGPEQVRGSVSVQPGDPVARLAQGLDGLQPVSYTHLDVYKRQVYRWNRPIYDIVQGRPHVRVENRVLPAGPTIIDTLANAAFYYGALRMLAQEDRPLWSRMSFAAAEDNFVAGAREGLDAKLYWPGRGDLPATELILRHLLPLADEGLREWGVSAAARDRYLSVVEGRCLTGVNLSLIHI